MSVSREVPVDPSASSEAPESTVLEWRVHRLRDEPRGIVFVTAGYALAFFFWRLVFPHPLALFLPVVALTSAMAEYLFPIRYRLTTRGAYADCGPLQRLHLAWSDVRRATRGAEGIYLSSLRLPSRLDAFRGIRIRFHDGNEAQVLETVRTLWRSPQTQPEAQVDRGA